MLTLKMKYQNVDGDKACFQIDIATINRVLIKCWQWLGKRLSDSYYDQHNLKMLMIMTSK